MSRSKDNTRMAEMLERLDAALKRSSPYFEDCRKMGDDTSSTARSTTKKGVISSGSCTTSITRHIPDEVKAQYIAWTAAGSVLHSGSQLPFEEGDLDTQYLTEALDQDPCLLEFCRAELPDGQGRESNPINVLHDGRPGDLRRRKERSFVGKERAESLAACRKKSRLEKEAKVQSAAAVDYAYPMLTPAVEGLMASMRPP